VDIPAWLRILLRPRIFIPVLLAAALLTFALSITDLPVVMGHIRSLNWLVIAEVFVVAFAYLAFKALLFRYLLEKLDIHTSWKKFFLAYCIGEMTLPVPSGVYVQNYVLRRVHGEKFGLSSAATTYSLFLEGALTLTILVFFSIPHWDWLPQAIIALFAAATLFVILLIRSQRLRRFLIKKRTGRRAVLFAGIRDLLVGLRTLSTASILFYGVLFSIAYLFCLALAFYLVGHGVGMVTLTFEQALTIYAFSLGVTLMLGGVMTQLGVIEVAGLGASQAWGYTLTQGLAMLLGFRIVWMGSVWLINGVMVLALHGEFRPSTANSTKKTLN
jgi:uncharacterized membrane protein YbhN (UPF0104 family)